MIGRVAKQARCLIASVHVPIWIEVVMTLVDMYMQVRLGIEQFLPGCIVEWTLVQIERRQLGRLS